MNAFKLQKDILRLIDWLCVEWGFCISSSASQSIADTQKINADSFAREVLKAEGMNPDYEVEWMRKIKRRFVDEFGTDSVDIDYYFENN